MLPMSHFVLKFFSIGMRLLYQRTIIVLTLLFCLGVGIGLWNMSRLSTNLIELQAQQNAAVFVKALDKARILYSEAAVKRIQDMEGITVSENYQEIHGGIPNPATYTIELGNRIGMDSSGTTARIYSNYPFPLRYESGGPKDLFEREALENLEKNPTKPFFRKELVNGRLSFRYAVAMTMQQSCVDCHNNHPRSPKRDWQVGDVRGAIQLIQPLDAIVDHTQAGLRETFIMLGGLSVLGISGIAVSIGRLRQNSQQLEHRVIERTAELQTANEEIAREKYKSESLLLNILPASIAQELKEGKKQIANDFRSVTILFADIVGFTSLSQEISPEELVNMLNEIFSRFDRLTERYGLEKIKTIGDNYMVAGGLPIPILNAAEAIAEMALEMQAEIAEYNAMQSKSLNLRIGINTGPVVAGVIGRKKFIYDLWGDAVNTASRMESQGIPGCIQVTESTYSFLKDRYLFEKRGAIEVKGKGTMETYFLVGQKPDINPNIYLNTG